MNRVCWWCVDLLSGTLAPEEGEAVRGDLAEAGETGRHALGDLLGLVVRRQATLWNGWRPWLGLVGLVIPLGLLLGLSLRRAAFETAIYAWFYVNNWTANYLDVGFRGDLFGYVAGFCVSYLALASWAWTSGFMLRSLSRRATGINGLFFFLLLFGMLLRAPRDPHSPNAVVFSLAFYNSILPLILLAVLVCIPAFKGMHFGMRMAKLPLSLQRIVRICAITTTAALVAQSLRPRWQMEASLLAVIGPLGCVVITAMSRRRELNR
jgi:hypothetical protein